jgi:lysozyme
MYDIDNKGLQDIIGHEGKENVAYWDADGGVWTIGVGHTGPEVRAGLVWTDAQVMDALRVDVSWAVAALNKLVRVPLDQNQVNALVDFIFNEGAGNFGGSTLLRLLNAGDYAGADAQFKRWNLAGGRVLAGLVKRREDEAEEFSA